MGVPIVYKSTYGNAPVLAAVNGSVVNLLNKCLVTGYGDKQGAGWAVRTTLQGPETEPENHFTLNPRGDAR